MALTDIVLGGLSVARSLIRSSKALDVVMITGEGFVPLFPLARPLTASVYETSELMEHPLEAGSVIADHIVNTPIEINLPMVVVGDDAYRSTYQAIRAVYKAGMILTVVTKTGSYPSMCLMEMPHEENPDHDNAILIDLRFREARFVQPQSGALTSKQTKDAKQTSTAPRGAQLTKAANASTGSKAADT